MPFRSTADEVRALRNAPAPPPLDDAVLVALDDPQATPLDQLASLVGHGRAGLALVCALVSLVFAWNAFSLIRARYRRDALPPALQKTSLLRRDLRRGARRAQ